MVATFRCSSRLSPVELEVPFIESLIAMMVARSRGTDGYSTIVCIREPISTPPEESRAARTLTSVVDNESRFELTTSEKLIDRLRESTRIMMSREVPGSLLLITRRLPFLMESMVGAGMQVPKPGPGTLRRSKGAVPWAGTRDERHRARTGSRR